MEKPSSVTRAEVGIWALTGMSLAVAVLDRQSDAITAGMFWFVLVSIAFFCILPYKIGQGANWARYGYALSVAFTLAVLFSGEARTLPKLDLVTGLLSLPIELWLVTELFRKDSSAWFTRDRDAA